MEEFGGGSVHFLYRRIRGVASFLSFFWREGGSLPVHSKGFFGGEEEEEGEEFGVCFEGFFVT